MPSTLDLMTSTWGPAPSTAAWGPPHRGRLDGRKPPNLALPPLGQLCPAAPVLDNGDQQRSARTRGHETFSAAAKQWLSTSARDGVRARNIEMPGAQTARGSRQGSKGSVDSAAAMDAEMLRVCDQIGFKASQKYRTAREALRYVDADHDGHVDQEENRYFFRSYDIHPFVADRFFDHLAQGRAKVDYETFVSFFGKYVEGAWKNGVGRVETPRTSRPDVDPAVIAREFGDVLNVLGVKAAQKFTNLRDAFRYVSKAGSISKTEMRSFFRTFNLPERTADRFYDRLDPDGFGSVDFGEFAKHVGPYIHPDRKPSVRRPRRSMVVASGSLSPRRGRGVGATMDAFPTMGANEPLDLGLSSASPDVDDQLMQELRRVLGDIARVLPLKFKHARDAFRVLDLGRVGRINRTEMRSFFRGFGHSPETADRIFNLLADESAEGQVDFGAFMSNFDEILGPQFRQAPRAPLIAVSDKGLQKEVNEIAAVILDRLTTKYRDVRDAFRALDLDKNGTVSQSELRTFIKNFGMPLESADKIFKALDDGSGEIQFQTFVELFGDVTVSKPQGYASTPKGPPGPPLRRLG